MPFETPSTTCPSNSLSPRELIRQSQSFKHRLNKGRLIDPQVSPSKQDGMPKPAEEAVPHATEQTPAQSAVQHIVVRLKKVQMRRHHPMPPVKEVASLQPAVLAQSSHGGTLAPSQVPPPLTVDGTTEAKVVPLPQAAPSSGVDSCASAPHPVTPLLPVGGTPGEIKVATHHRSQPGNDEGKKIFAGVWAAGIYLEALATVAAPGVSFVVGSLAATLLGSVQAAAWLGNLHDAVTTSNDKKVSTKDYKRTLDARDVLIEQGESLAQACAHSPNDHTLAEALKASFVMLEMANEIIKTYESNYRAPADATLRARRRAIEFTEQKERSQAIQQNLPLPAPLVQQKALVPLSRTERRVKLKELKAEKLALEDELKRIQQPGFPVNHGYLSAVQAKLELVNNAIKPLALYIKQTRHIPLFRPLKHLTSTQVGYQRDVVLTKIRMPLDIVGFVLSVVGVFTGVTILSVLAIPFIWVALPFMYRSGKFDQKNASTETLAGRAATEQAQLKLAMGWTMWNHFDELPDSEQTRMGKCIAQNLISAALQDLKVAELKKGQGKWRYYKGSVVRYFGVPGLGAFSVLSLAGTLLSIKLLGIPLAIAALGVGVTAGSFYGRMSWQKGKLNAYKNEGKTREALFHYIQNTVGDHGLRLLLTGDDATASSIVEFLQRKAPAHLHEHITLRNLRYHNEFLIGSVLSQDHVGMAGNPAAVPNDTYFARQVSPALGIDDQRSQTLRYNGPLLAGGEQQQRDIALKTFAPLFVGAKVYGADHLPPQDQEMADEPSALWLFPLEDWFDEDKKAQGPLSELIEQQAQHGTYDESFQKALRERAQQDPRIPKSIAALHESLRQKNDISLAQLRALKEHLTLPGTSGIQPRPEVMCLLEALLQWSDSPLEAMSETPSMPSPAVGFVLIKQALNELNLEQKKLYQQRRVAKGRHLFQGPSPYKSSKAFLKALDKMPSEEQRKLLDNLLAKLRARMCNKQGEFVVPDIYKGNETAYLMDFLKGSAKQSADLSSEIGKRYEDRESTFCDKQQKLFNGWATVSRRCQEHLASKGGNAIQPMPPLGELVLGH